MLAKFKSFLPLLLLFVGWLLSKPLLPLTPAIPYIVTAMLFMTFLKVHPEHIKLRASHWWLLALQLGLGALSYLLINLWHHEAAAAVMLCFLTPAATAGPAIVQLLKGDTGYNTTYVLLSHLSFILLVPLVFPMIGGIDRGRGLWLEMWDMFYEVAHLILPAIAAAWLLVWLRPKWAEKIGSYTQVNYTFWLFSLVLLIAHTTEKLSGQTGFEVFDLYLIAFLGLATCLMQYFLGHRLAPYLGGEQHALRHSLGQKNTNLSIWIAPLFLPAIVGMGITSYIIWQNIIISLLMSYYRKGAKS